MEKEFIYIMPSELNIHNAKSELRKIKECLAKARIITLDFKFTHNVDAEGLRIIKSLLLLERKGIKQIQITNCCEAVAWKIALINFGK
jgi:anti-anti-sigma regulatory factor